MTTAPPALMRPMPVAALGDLPPYVFAWLDGLKAVARARGANLLDLGIGNPDQPTPQPIAERLAAAALRPEHHGYPVFRGIAPFREAVARYMARRFGVTVDPATEVLCLSGAKEGIAQAALGFLAPAQVSLAGDVHYPVHTRAPAMIGAHVHQMPLRAATGWLPDLAALPPGVADAARMLVVNYPHNPTGALGSHAFLEEAVGFCRARGALLVSDLAYAELTFDGAIAPSALEVPGARDVTLEFHSCSKTFNMAGSRIGFVVGGRPLIDTLYAVRMNMGYGTPTFIQEAAAYALDHIETFGAAARHRYTARREAAVAGFRGLGWPVTPPGGSMFLWLPVPPGFTSPAWTEHLIDRSGVVVTPGSAFGPGGEGWFRVSLVAEPEQLTAACVRLQAAGIHYQTA